MFYLPTFPSESDKLISFHNDPDKNVLLLEVLFTLQRIFLSISSEITLVAFSRILAKEK